MSKAYILLFLLSLAVANIPARAADAPASPAPVLVELFTSEGCCSCPPADRLLQELESKQPISGAQIIVLSEHVDYWNSLGWKDPYSSRFFSERQSAYGNHFDLATVYTPQMIVDGESQFSGSNAKEAQQSIAKASTETKIPVQISSVVAQSGTFKVHIQAGPGSGVVYVAVALSHAESQVLRGANGGHRLSHVAVVQSLQQIGDLRKEKDFAKDIELKIPQGDDPANLRVIAFVQQINGGNPGRVLGSALSSVK
jgi:hypothetical protein